MATKRRRSSVRMALQGLRPALVGFRLRMLLLMALKGASVLIGLLPPLVFGFFVDTVLINRELRMIVPLLGVFVGVYIVETALALVTLQVRNRTYFRIVIDQRLRVLQTIMGLAPRRLERIEAGDLKRRQEEDTDAVEGVLDYLVESTYQWITIAATGVACFLISWKLGVLGVVMGAGAILLGYFISIGRLAAVDKLRAPVSHYENWLHESIQGWREVKSLAIESQQRQTMRDHLAIIHPLRYVSHFYWYANAALGHLKDQFVSRASLYFLGGILVFAGEITIGVLLAFIRYYARITYAIQEVNRLRTNLAAALPSVARSLEVVSWQRSDEQLRRGPVKQHREPVVIQFREVGFSYDAGVPIVEGVSFRIEPGEFVGVVGRSGSGKTTLFKLMLGMRDATTGQILLNESDVTSLDRGARLSYFSPVMQDSTLFNLSIRENLLLADPSAKDTCIMKACYDAEIGEFVEQLPDGLDTMIGERGVRLSGGQRQRLCIARALLQERPVLLLDEATSEVDGPSDRLIQARLRNLVPRRTVVAIAHRLRTVQNADRILLLDEDRVVVGGTHDELMDQSAAYRAMCAGQSRDDVVPGIGQDVKVYFRP